MTEQNFVPPHSANGEQEIIAASIRFQPVREVAFDMLTPDDFYYHFHKDAFCAIQELDEKNIPVDIETVSQTMCSINKNENYNEVFASLAQYLNNSVCNIKNIELYAQNIKSKAGLRKLADLGHTIASEAYAVNANYDDVIDSAERNWLDMANLSVKESPFNDTKAGIERFIDRLDEQVKSGSTIKGISTGFASLDELTSGFEPGELILLAARPSMGKTCLSLNFVMNALKELDKPVLYFSCEMPEIQLYERIFSARAKIPYQNIRTADMDELQWSKLSDNIQQMSDQNLLYVDESNPLTPSHVKSASRKLTKTAGIGMIIVDYLQLMNSPSFDNKNKTLEVADISRNLKALAKELNIPVIALSQLNRELEKRPNKRPLPSDLRDSGSLEQDADKIIFIYRDEVYDEFSDEKGSAEIIVAKSRNGALGTAKLRFNGEYQLFSE